MIRTVKIEVNAANPQLPLMPAEVFEDSAVTFIIIGVPRAHGKQTITGVSVGVINPDGQAAAVGAVRDGSAWVATVHAADIGGSGTVKNGILISASGKDENDSPVEAWILGAGDLVVMQHDGTIKPGERLNRVDWFETAPESPKIGNLAPLDGIIKIYTSTGWVPLGTSSVSWFDIADKPSTFPPSAHAATHAVGGSDPVTVAQSQVTGLIAALAAKAGTADVQLVPVYSDWVFSDGQTHQLQAQDIGQDSPAWVYLIDGLSADECDVFDTRKEAEAAVSLFWKYDHEDIHIDTTATRRVIAYRLGTQTPELSPKIALASPTGTTPISGDKAAQAEATRQALAGKQSDIGITADEYTVITPVKTLAVRGALQVVGGATIGGSLESPHIIEDGKHVAREVDFSLANPADYVSDLFSTANTSLMGVVRYAFNSDGTIKDRNINAITYAGGALPNFPAQVSGYARDFLLNVTATAAATDISLPESGATSVGDALAFEANHTYLVAITEIAAKKYYIRIIDTTPQNA